MYKVNHVESKKVPVLHQWNHDEDEASIPNKSTDNIYNEAIVSVVGAKLFT